MGPILHTAFPTAQPSLAQVQQLAGDFSPLHPMLLLLPGAQPSCRPTLVVP